jgi:ATP phosphoribosyltransferase regulatory subunit HisZ
MQLCHVDILRQQLITLGALYGYEFVDTDLVDDAELFLTSASAVVPRLYAFERRGKPYVLRPEFTAAAMKRYLRLGLQKPTRWQFFGSVFQQHPSMPYPVHTLSTGVEFIQSEGLLADLEVIELAFEISGLLTSQPLVLSLNHMGFVQSVLGAFDLDPFVIRLLISQPEQAQQLITENDQTVSTSADSEITRSMLDIILESTQYNRTMGGRDHRDITSRLLRKYSRNKQADQLRRVVDTIEEWNHTPITPDNLSQLRRYTNGNPAADRHLDYLFQLCESLSAAEIDRHTVHIRLSSTTNWQYYTGLMFTISDLSSLLINGGRYDNLSLTMGASASIPAVGFSCNLDSFIQQDQPICPMRVQADSYTDYRRTAKLLRDQGIAVIPADKPDDNTVMLMPDGTFTLGDKLFMTLDALVEHLKNTL